MPYDSRFMTLQLMGAGHAPLSCLMKQCGTLPHHFLPNPQMTALIAQHSHFRVFPVHI